jgi:hypothetical protein
MSELTARCKHGLLVRTCAYCSPKERGGKSAHSSGSAERQHPKEAGRRYERLEDYVPGLRKELVQAAREHRLVTYGEVMNRYGGRGYIGPVLDEVNRREHARGHPMLSAIVVHKGSGMPGEGFWGLISELHPSVAKSKSYWEIERNKVWAFDWPPD